MVRYFICTIQKLCGGEVEVYRLFFFFLLEPMTLSRTWITNPSYTQYTRTFPGRHVSPHLSTDSPRERARGLDVSSGHTVRVGLGWPREDFQPCERNGCGRTSGTRWAPEEKRRGKIIGRRPYELRECGRTMTNNPGSNVIKRLNGIRQSDNTRNSATYVCALHGSHIPRNHRTTERRIDSVE